MSKPRRDRTWSRRKTTRHAWLIDPREPNAPPTEALVVKWARSNYVWRALVVHTVAVEGEEPIVVQRWVPAKLLRPAWSDPNKAFGLH